MNASRNASAVGPWDVVAEPASVSALIYEGSDTVFASIKMGPRVLIWALHASILKPLGVGRWALGVGLARELQRNANIGSEAGGHQFFSMAHEQRRPDDQNFPRNGHRLLEAMLLRRRPWQWIPVQVDVR